MNLLNPLPLLSLSLLLAACGQRSPTSASQPTPSNCDVSEILADANLRDCQGDYRPQTAQELEMLRDCQTISGHLSLPHGVENLDALAKLLRVEGGLSIQSSTQLKDIKGLNRLTYTSELDIYNNPSLQQISGLNCLSEVSGDLRIQDNAKLTSISGLQSVRIAQAVELKNHPLLKNFSGYPRLLKIKSLEVRGNDQLQSLDLGSLVSIENSLEIRNNQGPLQLRLEQLKSIGSYAEIRDNQNMPALQLESLESVGGYLEIRDNPALNILELPRLRQLGDYLEILDNAQLPSCQTEAISNQLGGRCDCDRNFPGGKC